MHVRVLTLVDELTSVGEGPWEVFVTGHSLGGALATLCAYELATRRYTGNLKYWQVGCRVE